MGFCLKANRDRFILCTLFLALSAYVEKYLSNKSYQTTMTRKTLGLTRKPIKDAKPVAEKAEVMVEADPQKRFLNSVVINPAPAIRLESGSEKLTVRAMDLITPIGMGQRGLIVAPPGSGKSTILKDICQAVGKAYRLSRVHNAERKSSGRTMSGGMDARAMEIPRRLFGAARNIENGSSLTILATVLVDTGSRMDQVIFEEFKGTGNMELVLSRDVASQRIFPALDISKSSTRREELLLDPKYLDKIRALRRALGGLKPLEGTRKLVELLEKYPANAELLNSISGTDTD